MAYLICSSIQYTYRGRGLGMGYTRKTPELSTLSGVEGRRGWGLYVAHLVQELKRRKEEED